MIARVAAACAALWLVAGLTTARADTTIAPGDLLDVQVFGEPTLTQQLTVARDGSITMPLVGRVMLRGKSTNEAADTIKSDLRRYLRQPMVAVAIHTEANYNVLVLGNVKTPGRYTVQPGSRLSDALAAAGGLGPTSGPLPVARVSEGDAVKNVSLENLLRKGDLAANIPLEADSAVYVPSPSQIRVRVLGAVDHPGDVDINEGDRLAIAIAKAGNSATSNADLNHIRVTRAAKSGQPSKVMEFNLYNALERGDESSDLVMQPDDVVYVPQTARKVDNGGILGVLRRLVFPW